MIREATYEDLPRIIEMGRGFFEAAGLDAITELDEASLEDTLKGLIDNDTGIILVAEVDSHVIAMAGGLVYPFYFNHAHLTGQELFWWVEPKHRAGSIGQRLFSALEQWAKDQGAQSFSMVALDRLRPAEVGASYQRRGYRASEHTYIKGF